MNQPEYYKTHSMDLASAIQLEADVKLETLEWEVTDSGKTRALFVFKFTPVVREIIELFWNKELSVDALSYYEAIKFMKARVYDDPHFKRTERT